MSAILRWFHDGDVRYRAYFRASESAPSFRELIFASPEGQKIDIVATDRSLEDYSYGELLDYARRLRAELQARDNLRLSDAAAD
jgi:hypothetical protein